MSMFPGMGLGQLVDRASGFHKAGTADITGGSPGELLMFAASDTAPSLTLSKFAWPWNISKVGINERPFIRAPRDGVIRNMTVRARVAGAGGNGGTASYILEVNSVNTALVVGILNDANPHEGFNDVDEIAVSQGDRISVEFDWDILPTSSVTDLVIGMVYEVD